MFLKSGNKGEIVYNHGNEEVPVGDIFSSASWMF